MVMMTLDKLRAQEEAQQAAAARQAVGNEAATKQPPVECTSAGSHVTTTAQDRAQKPEEGARDATALARAAEAAKRDGAVSQSASATKRTASASATRPAYTVLGGGGRTLK